MQQCPANPSLALSCVHRSSLHTLRMQQRVMLRTAALSWLRVVLMACVLCLRRRVADLFQSVQLNVNNPHFLIMQGRVTKVGDGPPSRCCYTG